jgi:hypothetical protein
MRMVPEWKFWVGGGFKSYSRYWYINQPSCSIYGTKCKTWYLVHTSSILCDVRYLMLIYSGATRMKHFIICSILCKISVFNQKTQQQTWIDKLLSPPNQAQWWRAGKNFTSTPLGLNQGPLVFSGPQKRLTCH